MPRKTKETNEKKTVKSTSKSNKKIDNSTKNLLVSSNTLADDNQKSQKAKVATTKSKTASTKTTKLKKDEIESKVQNKKTVSKKTAKVAKTSDVDGAVTKKSSKTKEESSTKTTKKASTKKASAKSSKITKITSSTTKSKAPTKTKSNKVTPAVVEYYDLPYKYNQTVVKILYQNPTTLFVYWEISDSDIESYKKTYGDNFFETTRPVLIVYNDTMHYHFEIDINDFANSWYFNINDSKCDYRVELVRKPVSYNEKIKTDYVHITSSNTIETPNDRILFSTNEPYTVYFKNTKNGIQRKVNLPKLLADLNLLNKDFGFPIVRNVYDLYKHIYHIEDVGEFSISLTKPSSGNASSHSLSSKFI